MVYLAMTAAEMRSQDPLPPKIAWMACHFSPYGTGLTNLPKDLPAGSLLIVNDRTPVHGHDPILVRDTVERTVESFRCSGVLLDLQRPVCNDAMHIIKKLVELPCPVCVSDLYAQELTCPVFLPPVPTLQTAEEYLAPWQGREIWLEAALDGQVWTVTKKGSSATSLPPFSEFEYPHEDVQLFCHYGLKIHPNKAVFELKRTKNDLQNLMKSAEKQGVTHFVGLWQELGHDFAL